MKYIFSVLVLAFIIVNAATASQAQNNAPDREQIISLINKMGEAQMNYDVARLAECLSEDYLEVSPAGDADPRAKVLGFYTPEEKTKNAARGELLSREFAEVSIRFYDKIAIVTARMPFVMKVGEQKHERSFRCTFVCRKSKGKWLIVSSHYTGIRK
jgi:ketosteroid isomerase-like protein